MSDLEVSAHGWGDPSAPAQTPLEWGQTDSARSSLRKRDRPMSFDAGSLHLSEGNPQYSWGEQFLSFFPEGGNGNAVGEGGLQFEGLAINQNQGFGINGSEGLNSLLADSADSSECMERLQLQDGPYEQGAYEQDPGAYGEPAYEQAIYDHTASRNDFGEGLQEQVPDILAQLGVPGSGPSTDADSLLLEDVPPLPSTAVGSIAPASPAVPARNVPQSASKVMTSAEIQDAYVQSWGGQNLRKEPSGGQRQSPSLVGANEKAGEKPKPPGEKGQEWSVNGAKTQAASIIRDLFRRPEAKRQAVVVEGGRVGFLEKAVSRLPARNPKPSKPSDVSGPARSTSGPSVSDTGSGGSFLQPDATPLVPPPRTFSDSPEFSRADSSQKGAGESKEDAIADTMRRVGERVAGVLAGELDANLPQYDATANGEAAELASRMGGASETVSGEGGASDLGPGLGGVKGREDFGPGMAEMESRSALPDLTTAAGLEWLLEDEPELRGNGGGNAAGMAAEVSPADVSPELWLPGFAEWLAKEKGAGGASREAGSLGAAGLAKPLAGMTLQSEPAPSTPPQSLHRLWVELPPAHLRSDSFRTFRTAYREEVRRLRCWTATYVGEGLLPLISDRHFGICNALPGIQHRQARMMFTKGALWGAFVTGTLDSASPCDLYYARHDSQREFKEGPLQKLANLSKGMQHKMLNIVYLMEDLKDEATYGPDLYRLYGALHKSGGLALPPPVRGHAYHQISFPELTDPKPPSPSQGGESSGKSNPLDADDVELIKFEEKPLFNPCTLLPNGHLAPWGSFWFNKKRLLATGKGLQEAGERGRQLVQGLAQQTLSAHVKRYDCLASGGMPTLEKYLDFARYDMGIATGLGLAFCAIGQGLADAGQWEPTEVALTKLFEKIAKALTLTSEIYRVMTDLRTYQDDLVHCRLNAVAIRMREALCSNKEATDFLIAKVALDVEALESEILARALTDLFSRACWRLIFDVCRGSVARFLATEHDQCVEVLFHDA